MKKACIFFMILAVAVSVFPVSAMALEGDTGTDGSFSWRALSDGTVEITDYAFAGVNVVIPATLSGRTVSSIGESAFFMDNIFSVTFPESVKSIGDFAFGRCHSLSSVTFSGGLNRIGEGAFYACGLTALTLPDSVQTIDESAFAQNGFLASVTFGSGLQSIGAGSFADCRFLDSVVLPDGLQIIGGFAFRGSGVASVTFGNHLLLIGEQAFNACPLSALAFPDSLQTIGSGAFYQCTSLADVSFGNQLQSIGDDAFYDTGITAAILPDSLETIGAGAFASCPSLTAVTFGSSLQSIGEAAFMGAHLTTLEFPGALRTIGAGAFVGVPLHSVTFNSGLETIGDWAFSSCDTLTEVTLPASLKTLGKYNFYDCAGLQKAVVLSRDVAIDPWAFVGSPLTQGVWGLAGSTAESRFASGHILFHYLFAVSFETFGGTEVSECIVADGGTVPRPDDPAKSQSFFSGWFLDEGAAQPAVFPYTPSADTTIYAKWTQLTLSSSVEDGKIYTGGRITLTPSVGGGTWSYDVERLSLSGNTFTALKSGVATATYTVGGVSVGYDIAAETLTLASSVEGGRIYTGGRITLTPGVDGGTWDWDADYFSATFNSPATFTALKAGTSTITYTVNGVNTVYKVTIRDNELPGTGQDDTIIYVLIGVAMLALLAAGVVVRRRATCSK